MTEALAAYHPATTLAPQADSDEQLIGLWLHGRPATTSRVYAADVQRFQACTAAPLRVITLQDLQRFADTLTCLAPATQHRTLSAVKSLLAFGHRLGYLPFDVGRALRLPKLKTTLAERILAEPVVHRMLALETSPRNRMLLRLLYGAGLRVSELCALAWHDLVDRDEGGQLTVYGKGGKTRTILLDKPELWRELRALQGSAEPNEPVFRSRQRSKNGRHQLDESQVLRIVRRAAARAGVEADVSPHWLRHAHASHALDRGAPIHLVQATLGHANVATTGRYLHARPKDSSARYLAV